VTCLEAGITTLFEVTCLEAGITTPLTTLLATLLEVTPLQ